MARARCPALPPCLIAQVVGIWFYDDADCDRISALLQRIAATFAAPSEAAAGTVVRTGFDRTCWGGVHAADRCRACGHVPAARLLLLLVRYPCTPFVCVLQAPPAAPERQAAAAPAAESSGGDAGFWDRQVTVPEERQLQPANGAFVQQAAPPAEPAAAPAGSSNELARLFAGMKAPGATTAAAAPTAPAPVPVPPAVAAPMLLLTPQLLQQEAAGGAARAEQEAAAEAATAPGNLLLQSLLRGSQQQQAPQPAPVPGPRAVDITGELSAGGWVDEHLPCQWSAGRCMHVVMCNLPVRRAFFLRAFQHTTKLPCFSCRSCGPRAACQGVIPALLSGCQRLLLRHSGGGAEEGRDCVAGHSGLDSAAIASGAPAGKALKTPLGIKFPCGTRLL